MTDSAKPEPSRRALVLGLATTLTASGGAGLAGCASMGKDAAADPKRNKLGVLVIAGENLNTRYQDIKLAGFVFMVSQHFAEALHEEIEDRGHKVQIYLNRDARADTRKYVAELMGRNRRDGLIQVTVLLEPEASGNAVYMSARYNRLEWQKDERGESFVAREGIGAKYKLYGADAPKDVLKTPFGVFAKRFADVLQDEGYIGD